MDAKRFPEVYYLLGMIRSKQGDFLAAATEFREYLKVRPGTEAALGGVPGNWSSGAP